MRRLTVSGGGEHFISPTRGHLRHVDMCAPRHAHMSDLHTRSGSAEAVSGPFDLSLRNLADCKVIRWILRQCLRLLQGAFRIIFLLFKFIVRHLLRRLRRSPTTFGSARFATRRDLRRSGHLKGSGLILAKFGQKLLRYNQPEGSVIVFAPQGAGKGVGIVIPNLLDYRGSIICTDPKGETTPSPLAAGASSVPSGGSILPTLPPPTVSTRWTSLLPAHRPHSMTPKCWRT